MTVFKTKSWKCVRTSSTTWFAKRNRVSYIVSKIPSTAKDGLSWVCTIFTVLSNLPNPSKAKYSHWTGTITLSAAVRAFKVSKPRLGEQSSTMKSYSSRISSRA